MAHIVKVGRTYGSDSILLVHSPPDQRFLDSVKRENKRKTDVWHNGVYRVVVDDTEVVAKSDKNYYPKLAYTWKEVLLLTANLGVAVTLAFLFGILYSLIILAGIAATGFMSVRRGKMQDASSIDTYYHSPGVTILNSNELPLVWALAVEFNETAAGIGSFNLELWIREQGEHAHEAITAIIYDPDIVGAHNAVQRIKSNAQLPGYTHVDQDTEILQGLECKTAARVRELVEDTRNKLSDEAERRHKELVAEVGLLFKSAS